MNNQQKAIVIGVNLKGDREEFAFSMQEARGLAAACDIQVVGEITQNLDRIHKAHYIGSGKIEEARDLIERTEAALLIINDELSPSQIRVLEELLDRPVMDRTMLILDIFARRAKTRESQLQVQMAQLQYMLPRLVGQREALGRQGGGSGLKNRGAGETKLELDRRKVEEKIAFLSKELEALVAQRETQRKTRKKREVPVVSLVGYTNAGKSTILNAMVEMYHPGTNKQVFAKDMLFATLETSVRKIRTPDHKSFVLTDTVGFINKLPHHLVKAFRSTLEEAAAADLLIHVVDCSDPQHPLHMEVTTQTLREIGAGDTPVIYAFNKADLTPKEIPSVEGNVLYLSAKQQIGIAELAQVISRHLFRDYIRCVWLIPYDQGKIVSYLNDNATVFEMVYESNGVKMTVECSPADYEKYKEFVVANVQDDDSLWKGAVQ